MCMKTGIPGLTLREGSVEDVPLIMDMIMEFAEFLGRGDMVKADEEILENNLFGKRSYAEVLLAYMNGEPAGFAIYFHNFSTFLGRPGLYLEDLYVRPHMRGQGIGKTLLRYLARIAEERGCGRLDWCSIDWNTSANRFYRSIGAEVLEEIRINRLEGEVLKKLAMEE